MRRRRRPRAAVADALRALRRGAPRRGGRPGAAWTPSAATTTGYPAALRDLPDPPAVVHVAGDPERLRGLTAPTGPRWRVVGARRATPVRPRGRARARARAGGRRRDGGQRHGARRRLRRARRRARGRRPDARRARRRRRPAYPASKRRLYRRDRRDGCVVSEMPPGLRRVTAGASRHATGSSPRSPRLTVVVEARGALGLADHRRAGPRPGPRRRRRARAGDLAAGARAPTRCSRTARRWSARRRTRWTSRAASATWRRARSRASRCPRDLRGAARRGRARAARRSTRSPRRGAASARRWRALAELELPRATCAAALGGRLRGGARDAHARLPSTRDGRSARIPARPLDRRLGLRRRRRHPGRPQGVRPLRRARDDRDHRDHRAEHARGPRGRGRCRRR